ncbi:MULTISPECIES: hypothetical protein [Aeromonas]|jgi:hypothetical protein|uniref:Uncharacterized protein n=4 Tax=Aeromonas TaxID=642 RepID=A0A189PG89_AERSS|nr:hypothetical protein [Aeromonas salmonicida]ABO92446.1 hypothetical protein ASA_P4G147 [Aeromonas salmonicida subsp. salmonicida A449]POV85862.1 hypothetical protein C3418_20255 [Aeromonas sp. ASNIH8]ALL42211.1 hypothetical protein [Aeromonas salmonicida subsp. salmonicida]ALL42365.1 hypothetical protein [Aeromonas salmonicida subsp. salmonicida]ASI25778.1 hypothetical protein CE463_00365 [Aeromonas salmonicida]
MKPQIFEEIIMENSTTITTTKGYTLKVLREGLYYQCTHLNGIELTPDYQDVLVLKTDGSFLCGAAYTPANWAGVKV